MLWDLLFVTLAKGVTAAAQPVLRWRERTEGPRQRARIAAMPTTPIADVVAGPRVRIAGAVEPLASRTGAFLVRDGSGAAALVQPASAAGIWSSDGQAVAPPAAGDHVDVVGVARAADARIDRELVGAAAADTRVVFAGSELHRLFILRR
jgi:hypothetical protein